MSRMTFPNILAKIGLVSSRPRLDVAAAAAQSVLPQMIVMTPVTAPAGAETAAPDNHKTAPVRHSPAKRGPSPKNPLELAHRYSIGAFAILFLLVGVAAIQLGAAYRSSQIARADEAAKTAIAAKLPKKQTAGFNISVPANELQAKLQAIETQPSTLTIGQFSEPIDGSIIKSWLQITANKDKSEYYIHTNESAIGSSLIKEANTYARAPINQVTVTEDGASVVVLAGKNGRSLSDPSTLNTQAKQFAKTVLDSKGLQFGTPLADAPFQSVTPVAFDKLLVADVTTKKMWAFQNGQQVNSFLVSAGAPATPTPLGEYHVYAKFTSQDMRGTNPNGTKYFQPHVPWVNYFYEGSAVHGVYWHPLSWFGAINSSHGCVGLPVDQAQWVFNWAPIGTTVITHA